MKIGIYRTDGKFLFGNKMNIDPEIIDIIDSYGVWFYIEKMGEDRYIIISRFDNVRFSINSRTERCVAVAEGGSYSVYTLYKDFLKNFRNLIEAHNGVWEERMEEPYDFETETFGDPIYDDKIEGIIKEYPSISDRLKMIKLAEKLLKRHDCIIYSKSRPTLFEKCFWISSKRIEEKFDTILENLVKAIESNDRVFVAELSRERDFIKYIKSLYRYDKRVFKKLFRDYLDIIFEYTKKNPDFKSEIRKLGNNVGVDTYIRELGNLFRVTPAPYQAQTFDVTSYSKRKEKSYLIFFNRAILLSLLVVAFLIIVAYFFIIPFFFSQPFDVSVASVNNSFNIKITAKDLKENVPILIVIFNKSSLIYSKSIILTPNSSYNISWVSPQSGKYFLGMYSFGKQIYFKEISTSTNETNILGRLLKSLSLIK